MGFDARLAAACGLALLAVLVAGIPVYQRTHRQSPAPTAQDRSAGGQRETGGTGRDHAKAEVEVRSPVAAPFMPANANGNPAQHQRQAPRDDTPKITDWIQAGSAFFTLLATFALVWIGYNQRKISADQAKIMAGQRCIAAEQTDILREQARTARLLANLEQPVLYISKVERVEFLPHVEDAPAEVRRFRPTARIQFPNSGRTPAILLGVEASIVVTGAIPTTPDYNRRGVVQHMQYKTVESGTENAGSADITGPSVTEGEANLANVGQLMLIVFGRLIYRDPFGERAETGFGFISTRDGQARALPFKIYNYRKTYDPEDPNAPHADYEY